jgi:AcrR family transcriptional regulator
VPTARRALSADRVVEAAVRVADRGGLALVTMRNVGREVGVEAMSLYHHVAGKEALLDALADWVFAQVDLPPPGTPWRPAMTVRAESARRVLAAHPWGLGLLESRRSPGPHLLRHHEAVLARLREDGFSVPQAAHAFSVIDAYVYGFVLTETSLPFGKDESAGDYVDSLGDALPPDRYPFLAELVHEQVAGRDYRYGDEFGAGLELVLDGVERMRGGS